MSSSNTFQRDTSHRDIVLFRSGTLVWYPLVWVHTRCKVNLADWPFDLFNCSLRFGSWIYTSKNIQLQTLSNDIGSHGYTENSKWKLIGNYCISGDDLLENETYSFVTCWIQVQHQPGPHQYLIYWPIAFALLLQLSSLFLETRLWTRFHLNTLAFIALLLETLFLSYYLSDSSFETPRILKFLSQMLVLSFSTLFWSSVALNLSQSSTIKLPVRVLSVIKPIESWFSPEVDLELEEYAKSYQNSEMRTLIKLIDILWFCMSLCIIIGLWLYYF